MGTPKFKVVFVGDQSVGKTSIIVRYLKNTFDDKVDATIGMDFQTKTVSLSLGGQIRLQLWDTAGQERFRSLVNSYIRDAAAAVVCFDLTKRESFDNTSQWIEEVRSARGNEALIWLVGNKSDAGDKRQVPADECQRKAREVGGEFVEASAKTGDNVTALFEKLAEALVNRSEQGHSTAASASRQQAADTNIQLGAGSAGQGEGERKKKECKC
eukprot:TRINITY_DN23497_c0_g1_i1.p1 TRINITY_DN23497_c0_g1~~TRINITY_DN23497_c0_g1_i1.p1  ORF type:complete len:225 (-),score=50.81 TRINITY_DN23497_c0_g1_i1:138-776(-)